ncbi:MAG: M28 family metallopeptidase [Eubacteriales bacterium]|nr:M28 family metallopeptidase [Eubacteriales bacterium]
MIKIMRRRCFALILSLMLVLSSTAFAFETEMVSEVDFGEYGQQAYQYLQYIDKHLPDRDSDGGKNTLEAQQWIISELMRAGYTDDQIQLQDFTFENEDEDEITTQNIIVTLPGQSASQIIVGAHYDGTGTGDNGSGTALLLETACRLVKGDKLKETLAFAFFGAEENDTDGSAAYAAAMSDKEVANTAFMINMDSIICGDFCYLYGGVADFKKERVVDTDAFEKVYAISQRLGLGLHLIPWTFDDPAPGFDTPDYPSPSVGDWSDHISFAERGIQYVYIEASNWDIPGPDKQYDGDSETADVGRIMHTKNDTLSKIEKFFPGRALYHLQVFSLLINTVLTEK